MKSPTLSDFEAPPRTGLQKKEEQEAGWFQVLGKEVGWRLTHPSTQHTHKLPAAVI